MLGLVGPGALEVVDRALDETAPRPRSTGSGGSGSSVAAILRRRARRRAEDLLGSADACRARAHPRARGPRPRAERGARPSCSLLGPRRSTGTDEVRARSRARRCIAAVMCVAGHRRSRRAGAARDPLDRPPATTRRSTHGSRPRSAARARYRDGLALVLFDLDRFKETNDRAGIPRATGSCARSPARSSEPLRTTDVARPLGGDEFGALLLAGRARAGRRRSSPR